MTMPSLRFLARLALLLSAAACGQSSDTAAAAPPGAGGPGAGGPGGGGPGGAGRRPPLVLAASDVAEVRRGAIEAGIPISGDLRPIQTVVVRSRIEGDLQRVLVRPGQRVSAGQLLAEFEPSLQVSDRRAAEADRASARADVETARWSAEQSRELFRAGAIPERDLRVAEQALVAARARLAAAESRVQASSRTASDTRVLSPIAGTVEARAVEGGERVARGGELFTVVRGDVLELAGAVPERVGTQVRPGQPVRLSIAGRTIEGTVARVSPTVDPTTRSLTVFVEVPNPGGTIRGNSFASGRAVGRVVEGALLVPTAALRQVQDEGASAGEGRGAGSGTFVYRIRGTTADRAPVQLGLVDEAAGVAEVVDGLAPGDRVIVGNVAAVGRGTQVQVLGGGGAGGARAATAGGEGGGAAGAASPRAAGGAASATAASAGGQRQ